MKVSKVYEDDDILVVIKPFGLITHPKNAADQQEALTTWVASNYPNLKQVGEPFTASGASLPRCGIVHRLDKETSGLIVIAKNEKAFSYMKNLFQNREISKSYLALVYGHPVKPSGIIDAPLGRIGMKRTTQIQGKKLIDSKEAITEYEVIKTFEKYSLVKVSPKTGRTHQIRVHLKSMGTPVAGDKVYAPQRASQLPSLNRLFLHAYKLEFTTPSGKALTLETDLPEELQAVIDELEKVRYNS